MKKPPCEECLIYVLCKQKEIITCQRLYKYIVDNYKCPSGFNDLKFVYFSKLGYLYVDVKGHVKLGGQYDYSM